MRKSPECESFLNLGMNSRIYKVKLVLGYIELFSHLVRSNHYGFWVFDRGYVESYEDALLTVQMHRPQNWISHRKWL